MPKKTTAFGGEKGVSDQKEMRSFSNKLDKFMGWEGGYRETIVESQIDHLNIFKYWKIN